MATPVFPFPVQTNDTGAKEYVVRKAQFGDSYAQVSGEGINSSKKTWAITYSGRLEDVMKVASFFDERAGYKSFIWKDPTGQMGLYLAPKYEVLPYAKDVFRLTSSFEQAFAP